MRFVTPFITAIILASLHSPPSRLPHHQGSFSSLLSILGTFLIILFIILHVFLFTKNFMTLLISSFLLSDTHVSLLFCFFAFHLPTCSLGFLLMQNTFLSITPFLASLLFLLHVFFFSLSLSLVILLHVFSFTETPTPRYFFFMIPFTIGTFPLCLPLPCFYYSLCFGHSLSLIIYPSLLFPSHRYGRFY